MRLGRFEVSYLGYEFPDYFDGFGLGPGSEYSECAYGLGVTELDALDDCIEMLSQTEGLDLTEENEIAITTEYGKAYADADLDNTADSTDLNEKGQRCYHAVGIRYNVID